MTSATTSPPPVTKTERRRRTIPSLSTCAGIRGNGQNLFAHYGALARHIEEYGAVTCAAGGSSGSITTFLLESMWANPSLHFCDFRLCRRDERAERLALMLKSVIGLTEAGVFEDAAIVGDFVNDFTAAIDGGNLLELLATDGPAGVEAFLRLLRDFGPLINPELIELLLSSPDPVFHATDILEGLQDGVQFIVDDPAVFLRTSVLDFDEVASFFGVFGSFYAAYGPADDDGMLEWLGACTDASIGLTWEELALVPMANGSTCGSFFRGLFNEYRENFATVGGPNRAEDPVGRYLPVFGVTGVLTGEAVDQWQEARDAWIAAEPIPFEPDFDDVGVGYWGQSRELLYMERKLNLFYEEEFITEQFVPLGPATWREVLASSPAEPGFSPGVVLSSGVVSVGGWADPLRVLPLDALGADTTIAINRLGGVGGFTVSATELLNATPEEIDALYSTTDTDSTFSQGLEEASGVWCTDWDGQGSDPNLLFNDAYNSPLITSDSGLLDPQRGYPNVGPDFPIGGCVPGLAP
ncbi:MAG: hypothetical protein AAGA81_01765 [Acidobacteriota bacterium]